MNKIASYFLVVVLCLSTCIFAAGAVTVGMSFNEAKVVLEAAGAKDISSKVDIKFDNPDKSVQTTLAFFQMSDGTVAQIYADNANADKVIQIVSLEVGEKGKGFGADSKAWKKQKKDYPEVLKIDSYSK
jgi:hypothetical protein